MRYAITAESSIGQESKVAQHFGRSPYFVLVDMKNTEIIELQSVENPKTECTGPCSVPRFLKDYGVAAVISGGMGKGAQASFKEMGIGVATGAEGSVADALRDFMGGKLSSEADCEGGHQHGHGCGH